MTNKITKAELEDFEKDEQGVKKYSNGEIIVYWKPELCIHSANCLIGLPGVFNTRKKPWINIYGSGSREIIKVVDTCPSRALTYLKKSRFSTKKPKTQAAINTNPARLQILKNGPLLISGNFLLRGPDNKKIKPKHDVTAICRCGASKTKPFCDGSHVSIGFSD